MEVSEPTESNNEMEIEEQGEQQKSTTKEVYIPGVSRKLRENEEWEFDRSAYKIFHKFATDWPCLSFDIMESLNGGSIVSPNDDEVVSIVAGSQADGKNIRKNQLYVMKLVDLTPMSDESKSDDDDDDDDNDNTSSDRRSPVMHCTSMIHHGEVNRIRVKNLGQSTVCAVWNSFKKVQLWNLTDARKSIDDANEAGKQGSRTRFEQKPLMSFEHGTEGFGLSWSCLKTGTLASGDGHGSIFLWTMAEGGVWVVDQRPLVGHKGSVEDLVWSPTEDSLLASCSTDFTIKLWDTRLPKTEACVCTVPDAHASDVNVISWNKFEPLLISGGDDALLNIWSLKTIQYKKSVARFKHHRKAITSVEWSPHESTTMVATSEDDQTSVWDLSVEQDGSENIEGLPHQLLFIHMGQKEVKEVHWHNERKGLLVNTAASGFNVFQPTHMFA